MIDIVEILVHWQAGRSQHELAASLGVDRKTIRKYTAPAVAAGMAPGGPARSRVEWAARLGLPTSRTTLLRMVRALPDPQATGPHRSTRRDPGR